MENFFRFIEEPIRTEFLGEAARHRFVAGDVILAEGERRRAIFLIKTGSVRVERGHMGFSVEISRLGPGEIFGEMSFVEDFGASASVIADGPVELAVIDEPQLDRFAARDVRFYGQFFHSLAEILSQRLRETTVRGISDYAWGGASETTLPPAPTLDEWGGGSPLRESDEDHTN